MFDSPAYSVSTLDEAQHTSNIKLGVFAYITG